MKIGIKLQTHNTVKLVQPKKLSQIFLHSSSKILRNLDLKKQCINCKIISQH